MKAHTFTEPREAPIWQPEFTPSFTLDRQIAVARKDMGEKRWSELNGEWA